ncbi:MAG: ketosteroid isomerase-like protein [Gammaproteobacteria bacterium]|jgi:ketosteroid isomerase-like protein
MSENQNIVRQWFDHIGAGNAEAAFALFSDDIVYDLKGTTPVSGVFRGLDSIVNDFFVPWRKQIDGDLVVRIDDTFGEGDRVVALGHGAAKTIFGLPYENDYAFVCTVRDGKICKIIEFLDTALVETAAYGRRLVEP